MSSKLCVRERKRPSTSTASWTESTPCPLRQEWPERRCFSYSTRKPRDLFSTAQEAGDSTIALLVHPEDIRVRKNTPDSFHKTELQSLLQARNVEKLAVCGLQSDFCVDWTVRRALGYPVVLVSVAHSTVDNGVPSAAEISAHHNTTLANIWKLWSEIYTNQGGGGTI